MGRRSKKSVRDDTSSSHSSTDPFRHLEGSLAGVIFGCTNDTYDECVNGRVFGLPASHFVYVQLIKPGTPIFLFNYSRRELHGVFVATSDGNMDIKPHGWTGGVPVKTNFPAQVHIKVHKKAEPLKEYRFKPAICDNYDSEGPLFQFELDGGQVKRLCKLFGSSVPSVQDAGKKSLLEPPITARQPRETRPMTTRLQRSLRMPPVSASQKNKAPPAEKGWSSKQMELSPLEEPKRTTKEGSQQNAKRKERVKIVYKTESGDSVTRQLGSGGKKEKKSAVGGGRSEGQKRETRLKTLTTSRGVDARATQHRQTLGEATGLISLRPRSLPPQSGSLSHREPLASHQDTKENDPLPMLVDSHLDKNLLMTFFLSKEEQRTFTIHESTDTLVLLGGVDDSQCFSHLEILKQDGENWEKSFLIPSLDFVNGQAVSLKHAVYILGGGTEYYLQSADVQMLQVGHQSWKTLAAMPLVRSHFSATAVNDTICTFGGGTAYDESHACHWYDCGSDSWRKGPSLKQKRTGAASCTAQSIVFATGGGAGRGTLKTVELLDCRSARWQSLAPMSTGRKHHCCIVLKDELWALGGQGDDGTFLPSVEVYDQRNQKWTDQTPLLHPRAFFTAECIQNELHVIGGAASPSKYQFLGGERFSRDESAWLPGLGVGSSKTRGHHSSCVLTSDSH